MTPTAGTHPAARIRSALGSTAPAQLPPPGLEGRAYRTFCGT